MTKYLVSPTGVVGAPVLRLELTFSPSAESSAGSVTGTGVVSNGSIQGNPTLVGPFQMQGSFILNFSPPTLAGQYVHLQSEPGAPGSGSIQANLLLGGPNQGGSGSFSYFDDRLVHTFAQATVTVES